MRQYTNFEMFAITKEYINKHHSDNPMDFVTNVYIFYFMSGRFPNASISQCCNVVEALRTHYIAEFSVISDDLSYNDDELPFY